jgi:hypothetical protein
MDMVGEPVEQRACQTLRTKHAGDEAMRALLYEAKKSAGSTNSGAREGISDTKAQMVHLHNMNTLIDFA